MNSLKKPSIALALALSLSVAYAGPSAITFAQAEKELLNLHNANTSQVEWEKKFVSLINDVWFWAEYNKRSLFDHKMDSQWKSLYGDVYDLINRTNNRTLLKKECYENVVSVGPNWQTGYKPGILNYQEKDRWSNFTKTQVDLMRLCKS
jgi:hypothetical protein